ncbi:MAG: hypothetical protein GKC07_07825 [Methanomicrobiales archaeon]|nr:hypothetical protein [Methanomicrobiales archaeon]
MPQTVVLHRNTTGGIPDGAESAFLLRKRDLPVERCLKATGCIFLDGA